VTPITWRGLTADYSEAERNTMRNLATMYPDEATILHELKAILDASIIDTGARRLYAGAQGRWDERRNTSLVRVTHRYEDVRAEIEAYEPAPEDNQLRMDEAA
jgi:hypothetical protein